jgi:hypothetical protein
MGEVASTAIPLGDHLFDACSAGLHYLEILLFCSRWLAMGGPDWFSSTAAP